MSHTPERAAASAQALYRLLATAALLATVAMIGCGGNSTEEKPGNPAVYDRIAKLKNCGKLQAEFDQAMDNAERREPGDKLRDLSLAYADAADERLADVGCYDKK